MKHLIILSILLTIAGCSSQKKHLENLGCTGTNVAESPDPAVIEKIIKDKNSDLRWCHQSRNTMSSMPEFLDGEMTYNFTLNNQGKVVQSTLDTKMAIDENMIRCMKAVLDRTQYQCSQIKENVNLSQVVKFYAHDY